jgi:hypothetical protein
MPFLFKKYIVKKTRKDSVCRYIFSNDEGCCEHLLLWESAEIGAELSDEITNLEWITRMSNLPFRVWDVLQEMINNDGLPCEVRIRAFYVGDNIVFVFGNDAKALTDAVLEKTKEYIRGYPKGL